MGFRGYVAVFRRNWFVILTILVVATGGMIGLTYLTPATYTASSKVFLSVSADADNTGELSSGNLFIQDRIKSYADLATTETVLSPVISNLGLDDTVPTLADRVSVTVPLDTVVLQVEAEDTDPTMAANIANQIVAQLPDAVKKVETGSSASTIDVDFTVTQRALVPTARTSPSLKLNLSVGLLLGAALGVMTALVRDRFDTRVHEVGDLMAWFPGYPVLARIPRTRGKQEAGDQLVWITRGAQSEQAETFRSLRTVVSRALKGPGFKSLVVTSSELEEGKTTVAVNLALAFAEAGLQVVYVDADLRERKDNKQQRLSPIREGLTEVLLGESTLEEVTIPREMPPLNVIGAGVLPENPSELLGMPRMGEIARELADTYDVVIYDTSAVAEVTDAATLMNWADAAILVVGLDKVRRRQVAFSLQSFNQVDAEVLGFVLNFSPDIMDELDLRDALDEAESFADRLQSGASVAGRHARVEAAGQDAPHDANAPHPQHAPHPQDLPHDPQ